jgi:hypothetical protein
MGKITSSDFRQELWVQLDRFMRYTSGSVQRPIAGSDVVIVHKVNGAFENVNCVLVNPAIPVALVELLTV